jgi:hypothetical protein
MARHDNDDYDDRRRSRRRDYDDEDEDEDRPRRRRYQDDAGDYDFRTRVLPHSGLGIASLVIAVLAGVGLLALFTIAGIMAEEAGGDLDENSPKVMLLGVFAIGGLGLALLGAALGLAGVLQKGRKKLFGTLGLVINALVLLGSLGLMCVGALMNN